MNKYDLYDALLKASEQGGVNQLLTEQLQNDPESIKEMLTDLAFSNKKDCDTIVFWLWCLPLEVDSDLYYARNDCISEAIVAAW